MESCGKDNILNSVQLEKAVTDISYYLEALKLATFAEEKISSDMIRFFVTEIEEKVKKISELF